MKRKLTLGLLVFFVGVLITACGSKNSSTTTNNDKGNTNIINPINQDASCKASGICTFTGTMTISNMDLYKQAFGYTNGNQSGVIDPIYQNGQWNTNGFFNSLIDTGANCAAQTGIAWILAQLGVNNTSADCTVVYGDSSTTTNNGVFNVSQDINPSPAVNLQGNYSNSNLVSLGMAIRTGNNGGNGDTVEFYPENSNSPEQVLYNQERTIRITWNGTGYTMDTQSGTIGTINQ